MKNYRMKKTLTYLPFFSLILIPTIIIIFLGITRNSLTFFVLCLVLSSMFIIFSLSKFSISDEYITPPYFFKMKKIQWENVFELKIRKSTISGYLFITVSYFNDSQKSYFIVGSWFNESDIFVGEIKKKSINAKVYE